MIVIDSAKNAFDQSHMMEIIRHLLTLENSFGKEHLHEYDR